MAVVELHERYQSLVDELLAEVAAYNPNVDRDLLTRAFSFAPRAHRLGIHQMKWELEDLAFQALHPRKYAEIKAMVTERRTDRESHVREAAAVLKSELDKVDIPAEIVGRAKHFYSIYDKMAKKGKEFNEIYDLTAMRVIVERVGDEGTRDCYGALGLVHSLWK